MDVTLRFPEALHRAIWQHYEVGVGTGTSVERHLHRKIRIALDHSPYELLLCSRIQSASEALAKTTLPIIRIAIEHAFCDQSAFTQQFRKRTDMTPKEFRQRRQG